MTFRKWKNVALLRLPTENPSLSKTEYSQNLPAPPCLGEALRRGTLTNILIFFGSDMKFPVTPFFRRVKRYKISFFPSGKFILFIKGFSVEYFGYYPCPSSGGIFTFKKVIFVNSSLPPLHIPAPIQFLLIEASELLCTYDRVPARIRFCPGRISA